MENAQSVGQLLPGQTAQLTVEEGLGTWLISRTNDGLLVIDSPEIPTPPDERKTLVQGALFENLGADIPANTRFCMDDERVLRLQQVIHADDIDEALIGMAQLYASVVDQATHKGMPEEDTLDLDALSAEPSMEVVEVENRASDIIQKLYASIENDPQLRELLYVENSGEQGVIEVVEDEVSIAVIPDLKTDGIHLYYCAYLFSNGKTQEVEMATALWANSILRLGSEQILGCMQDDTCLYLRRTLNPEELDAENLKDAMAALMMIGDKLASLLGEGKAPSSEQKKEFSMSMEAIMSRGGMFA